MILDGEFANHAGYPAPAENQSPQHTCKCLTAMAFCLCQQSGVLGYFLRTENKTESKWWSFEPMGCGVADLPAHADRD